MLSVLVFVATIFSVVYGETMPEDERIVGGSSAYSGQFPHQVSLRARGQHFCGGSIIGPNKILTAAHCIYGNSQQMTVVVGSNYLNSGGKSYNVISAVYHDSYDPQTNMNDVAVLTIDKHIAYSTQVRPIGLISQNPSSGSGLTLSGWGLTTYPGNIPNSLQFVHMAALDLNTCSSRLQGANPITTGHVCTTTSPGLGACQGDSGGPLISAGGQQVGIVSWGIPCARGLPDVYTSVAFYRDWIISQ